VKHLPRAARVCAWCTLAGVGEVSIYLLYAGHAARFHWFTHFFVGASAALAVMAVVAVRTRRSVPLLLIWPMAGHILAMIPDFLFSLGLVHRRWMDVFLAHISSHYLPGRNLTWFAVFLAALATYLGVLARQAATATAEPG